MLQATCEFHFCAAHRLPNHPGPCRNLHGHNYRLLVTVEGPLDQQSGMVHDFYNIKRVVQERIVARLDHGDLNTILDNPTAEQIAVWVWQQLKPDLPLLAELTLFETHDCSVRYRGEK